MSACTESAVSNRHSSIDAPIYTLPRENPLKHTVWHTLNCSVAGVLLSGTTRGEYAFIISWTIGEMTETLDGQQMKCQICGRASVPGSKLCSDCRSARQRAF